MNLIEEILTKPPIISAEELREVKRLAIAMGRGDSCTLECDEDFSTVVSVILLAGLAALDE